MGAHDEGMTPAQMIAYIDGYLAQEVANLRLAVAPEIRGLYHRRIDQALDRRLELKVELDWAAITSSATD